MGPWVALVACAKSSGREVEGMLGEPYVVTFRALNSSGGDRHTYSYKIEDARSGVVALKEARRLAETETERAARGGLELDKTWHEIDRVTSSLYFDW